MKEQVSGILSVLFILVIFISILAMTYFVTKLIGRGYIVQGSAAKHIKIIDKVFIGKDKTLLIIQSAGKTMLLGVTAHHIEKLCDLDEQELSLIVPDTSEPAFLDMFKNALKNLRGEKSDPDEEGKKHGEL